MSTSGEPAPPVRPAILTNMAFWQSPLWVSRTTSIYRMDGRRRDPAFAPAWLEAILLFIRRRAGGVVLTMGARPSLCYGLICALFGVRSRQVMTEVFLDAPRPHSLLWRVKNRAYRLVAGRSIGILTNSSAEIAAIAEQFRLPRDRLRFVPLNTNIGRPERAATNDGFVLAAGRTHRDYDCLLRAAPEIRAPIVIVCGRADSFPSPLPSNVTVLREVPREVYLDHLRRCSVVALPLLPITRATGQVVLLEAMAMGKPVAATRVGGTTDYVTHERNGLLVPGGDPAALAQAVNRLLGDPALAARLAAQGLEDSASLYAFDTHAESKLQAVRELWMAAGVSERR